MLKCNFISRSVPYIPLLISQRWKVRLLPKEHYEDNETPFMPATPPRRSLIVDFFSVAHRKKLTLTDFKDWKKRKIFQGIRDDQRYMPERHKCLGPDLATTHFITVRGGKVKFSGKNIWMTKDNIKTCEIPSSYTPGYFVEELDASGLNLLYEGFDNLCNLRKLKKLTLNNCPYIDDWCLSRVHLFQNTLEYLDISGCELVTERGICTLHVLKNLKTLIIHNTPNIQNKELVCLLLQDVIPQCEIIGVNYKDPILLKRLENFLD